MQQFLDRESLQLIFNLAQNKLPHSYKRKLILKVIEIQRIGLHLN